MNATELLSYLRDHDIHIWVEGDKLRLNGVKGSLTPDLQEQITRYKQDLITLLSGPKSRYKKNGSEIEAEIVPIPREQESYPLSFAQERMWFLDRFDSDSPIFNVYGATRFKGDLDISILQRSLDYIVTRHEVLHTNYREVDGHVWQFVSPAQPVPFQIFDVSDLPEDQKLDKAFQIGELEAQRPFNLQTDLMLRAALVRLSEQDHIIVVAFHHIASDAWSQSIFGHELVSVYTAYLQGAEPQLPPLPIQYIDYAVWQQEYFRKGKLDAQLEYWKEQLGGDIPVLDLPTDYPRPASLTYEVDSAIWKLSPELSTKLRGVGKGVVKGEVTLFMTLVAAFKVLLFRYTGQKDVLVGTPIAGRNDPETETLIGLFLNSLVLRSHLTDEHTFVDVLENVRRTALDAYSNQDIPFEKLLVELQPERDPTHTPFFQVFVNMPDMVSRKYDLPGQSFERLFLPDIGSKFDITLYIFDYADGIYLSMAYKSRLYSAARMRELLAQYHQLLEQIVEDPNKPISTYSLLTELAKVLLPDLEIPLSDEWNGAVHEVLQLHARYFPDRIALADKNGTWTYRDLDEWSNRLANYLISKGVGKGNVVAIYAHRSASLVWAILGVFKAGAAYTILDPQHPSQRLIGYLKQAQPVSLIKIGEAGPLSDELNEYFDEQLEIAHLRLPDLFTAIESNFLSDSPVTYPRVEIGPHDLACVTFTSGSTGTPKGVRGEHGSLTHFLPWLARTFRLTEDDHFSMLSGLAHDPLQRDIFTAIWAGARICIPDPTQLGTPGWLTGWMRENQITVTHLTPAMGQLIIESSRNISSELSQIPSWQRAFFVGDKLYQREVECLNHIAPNLRIINTYGATETQRALSYYLVPRPVNGRTQDERNQPDREKEIIPLGQGMEDAQILVLNPDLELAGIGEIGEIYIRSHHLSLGYLDDDRLTAEKFVNNPHSDLPGDRLYRTGDYGRFSPDGNVDFAYRADDQVQVRGYRIEPAEIEAAISSHPAIRNAVVVLQLDEDVDKSYLVAYYTAINTLSLPSTRQLRNYLQDILPVYMLPSAYIALPEIPLTPNGKIDKGALPQYNPQAMKLGSIGSEPTNETESRLLRIWKEVLEIESLGIHDDFFEHGGHSILAIQLFARIETEFNLKLPLVTIFQSPTVAKLAYVLDEAQTPDEVSAVVPLKTSGSKEPLFIVHGFGGGVLGYTDLIRHLDEEQPVYGLEPRGIHNESTPHTSMEEMAAYYIQAMRSIQPEGPYHLGGYCYGGIVAYEIARQLAADGIDVGLVSVFEGYAPIKVSRNPKHLLSFARNLPKWFKDFTNRGFRNVMIELWRRFKLQSKGILNTIGIKLNYTLEDLVENAAEIPPSRRMIFESQIIARYNYIPQKYPGKVTLFRVRSISLTRFTDPDLGWGHLAEGGVDVKIVPGHHYDMLQPPHVDTLAKELSESLQETHNGNG